VLYKQEKQEEQEKQMQEQEEQQEQQICQVNSNHLSEMQWCCLIPRFSYPDCDSDPYERMVIPEVDGTLLVSTISTVVWMLEDNTNRLF